MTTESSSWYYDPENLNSPAQRLPWGLAGQLGMSAPYLTQEDAEADRLIQLDATPGVRAPARPPKIPTVVVHVTDDGILEAVCADVEVRVVLVDYCATQDHVAAVTAPDGDLALISTVQLMAFPDRVAEYVQVAGLPAVAEPRL